MVNIGDYVQIQRLVQATQHNETTGFVRAPHKNGRFAVETSNGMLSIKTSNLISNHAIRMPTVDLVSLGGGGTGGNGAVANPPYGRLLRSWKLPPPHSQCKFAKSVDATTKDRFLKIYSGKSRFDYSYNRQHNNHILTVSVSMGESGKLFDAAFFIMMENNKGDAGNWGPFKSTLTEIQKNALRLRVLHLAVRNAGSNWPLLAASLCLYLRKEYRNRKWLKEEVDIAMTHADLFLLHGINAGAKDKNPIEWHPVSQVAESLECVGRHEEAAELYMQVVRDFNPTCMIVANTTSADLSHKRATDCSLWVRNKVGNAYKRASQWEKAEEHYIAALYLDRQLNGSNWNVNDGLFTRSLFLNLVNLYYEWNAEHFALTAVGQAFSPQLMIDVISYELLCYAGWDYNSSLDCAFIVDSIQKGGVIKPEFQTKEAAYRAFAFALATPSVKKFRAAILACVPTGLRITKGKVETDERRHYQTHRTARMAAKAQRATPYEESCEKEYYLYCGMCANPSTSLQMCPCHEIGFCSKKCQLKNWESHKKTCSYHALEKRNKAVAAKGASY